MKPREPGLPRTLKSRIALQTVLSDSSPPLDIHSAGHKKRMRVFLQQQLGTALGPFHDTPLAEQAQTVQRAFDCWWDAGPDSKQVAVHALFDATIKLGTAERALLRDTQYGRMTARARLVNTDSEYLAALAEAHKNGPEARLGEVMDAALDHINSFTNCIAAGAPALGLPFYELRETELILHGAQNRIGQKLLSTMQREHVEKLRPAKRRADKGVPSKRQAGEELKNKVLAQYAALQPPMKPNGYAKKYGAELGAGERSIRRWIAELATAKPAE